MDEKRLEAIQGAVRHARDTIKVLASENYPDTPVEDDDLRKMFYSLNEMCILLSQKIRDLEVPVCRTTDIIPASSSASGLVS